jgi:ABC-type amino acid transport substrate-binding protein
VNVTFIPIRLEQLQHALLEGVGDVGAYGVVVTPEREELVLFTTPIDSNVKQVIVTGPKAPPIANLEWEGGVRQPSDGGWRPELGRRW